MIVAVDLEQLAAAAFAEVHRHAPQTPQRRAASHLWVALTVPPAKSITDARSAIASFGTERTQAGALELLTQLVASVNDSAKISAATAPAARRSP